MHMKNIMNKKGGNDMKYAQLKRNMILLIILGVMIAYALFGFNNILTPIFTWLYSILGIFIFFAIVCYPLAIVYGYTEIKNVYYSISKGMNRPFIVNKQSKFNGIKTYLNYVVALLTTLLFGWVYGVYLAWKRLMYAKKFPQT